MSYYILYGHFLDQTFCRLVIKEDSFDGKKDEEEIEHITQYHNEVIKSLESTRKLREKYASYCFWFLVCWSIVLFGLLLLSGESKYSFHLSDSVIIALIGNTTVNVIGLVYIIAKGLVENINYQSPSKVLNKDK